MRAKVGKDGLQAVNDANFKRISEIGVALIGDAPCNTMG